MYLVSDLVKFRDRAGFLEVIDVNDSDPSNPRYVIRDVATGRAYSFWVEHDDLELVNDD